MRKLLVLVVIGLGASVAVASQTGCTGQTRVQAGVAVAAPSLVYLGPGLWVVADSDDPIFYSSGLYWLYRDGYWYRSNYYWGGWEFYQPHHVPVVVRQVYRPRSYRHYLPRPGQQTRRAPAPDYRHSRPVPRRRNEVVPSRRGGR